VSSLASAASLLVAASQLKEVSDVIGAIRAADLASGDFTTPIGIIEKPGLPPLPNGDAYHASCDELQRPAIKQPCYCPHPIVKTVEKRIYEPARIVHEIETVPDTNCTTPNPIQPPWKMLPWMDRPVPRVFLLHEIKPRATVTDIALSGRLIDVVV
jgi:hypothetical protein